ncbi:MAG TPA: beta-ketoacyl synthase N-terminal-like domain-containing protein, partial [Chloroflexota bacterium]|nr:beta-ketoacyl synthase N-terminal-like domain-containing protein [Chloroflexota bacterium]
MTAEQRDQLSPVKQALLAVETLQARIDAMKRAATEPIAIVGLGCRLPGGAGSPETFWQLLHEGVDAISAVPADRWDVDAYYDPEPGKPGKMCTRYGGFLDGVDSFDAAFFDISPREAAAMDPQQRLLLEVAWEALEDAGQTREQLAGSQTGVFVGIYNSDYSWLKLADPATADVYAGMGTAHSVVAGRLSYLLDLRGPSMPVDTACSSSLVAIHLACQSLRTRESDLALAGGVNLILSPLGTILTSQLLAMAPDGRCKTFDAAANGFVRGEGCGVVVLKRLSEAVADGDHIWALIRGSAVNQDGHSPGLTAPNLPAQQAVIRQALANAGVPAARIGYVEAHGTGTSLGDPIEIEALKAAFGGSREPGASCAIGSVKTNMGHLEATAGVAGLIKAVLALTHGIVPPHLHFKRLNPRIALDGTPFFIPTRACPWPLDNGPRYAGVSAFSFSGTNAHVVLEEAPRVALPATEARSDAQTGAHLLPLSARSPQDLQQLASRYRALLLDQQPPPALAALCATTARRRSHHPHRLTLVGHSAAELVSGLDAFLAGQPRTGVASGAAPAARRP